MSEQIQFDNFDSDDKDINFPNKVETISVPLMVRYFNPLGFFSAVGATWIHQDVDRGPGTSFADGDDSFVVVDAAIGFRFPQRRGLISLEARNVLDRKFKFQDDNFRKSQDDPTISPFIPEFAILARATLNF